MFLPHHDLRPVLQRLHRVDRLDCITPRQIRDRARKFENTVTPAPALQVQVQV